MAPPNHLVKLNRWRKHNLPQRSLPVLLPLPFCPLHMMRLTFGGTSGHGMERGRLQKRRRRSPTTTISPDWTPPRARYQAWEARKFGRRARRRQRAKRKSSLSPAHVSRALAILARNFSNLSKPGRATRAQVRVRHLSTSVLHAVYRQPMHRKRQRQMVWDQTRRVRRMVVLRQFADDAIVASRTSFRTRWRVRSLPQLAVTSPRSGMRH